MSRESDLQELVERLKTAAGANLTAVVLYGSGADQDFRKEHSDLNILCLLKSVDAAELAKLQPAGVWWSRKSYPAPLIFTLRELQESADVFAIELIDMKARHRMLLGEDFLTEFEVPMTLHRLQVERELRTSVIRLRQAFLRLSANRAELTDLMIASASTFATLFRHALIALGETAPDSRREALDRLAAKIGVRSRCHSHRARSARRQAPHHRGRSRSHIRGVPRCRNPRSRGDGPPPSSAVAGRSRIVCEVEKMSRKRSAVIPRPEGRGICCLIMTPVMFVTLNSESRSK